MILIAVAKVCWLDRCNRMQCLRVIQFFCLAVVSVPLKQEVTTKNMMPSTRKQRFFATDLSTDKLSAFQK
jgi:hypothetical protein